MCASVSSSLSHTNSTPPSFSRLCRYFKKATTEIERIASNYIMYLFLMLDRFFKITYILVICIVIQFSRNGTVTNGYISHFSNTHQFRRERKEWNPPTSFTKINCKMVQSARISYWIRMHSMTFNMNRFNLLFVAICITKIITGGQLTNSILNSKEFNILRVEGENINAYFRFQIIPSFVFTIETQWFCVL